MKKEEYVKICPKCGSADVSVDFSNPAVWSYGAPSKHKCKACGHVAAVFPEVAKSKTKSYKPKKETQEKDVVDVKTGSTIGLFTWIIMPLIPAVIVSFLVSYWAGLIVLVLGLLIIWFVRKRIKK